MDGMGGARSTPPPSLSLVRECFDRCGGVAARAFYVIGMDVKLYSISLVFLGNYVLAQEMMEECNKARKNLGEKKDYIILVVFFLCISISVFVVDRFYSSTCGYTIGKVTAGEPDAIDQLVEQDPDLVRWPVDLISPALCIILNIG